MQCDITRYMITYAKLSVLLMERVTTGAGMENIAGITARLTRIWTDMALPVEAIMNADNMEKATTGAIWTAVIIGNIVEH